MPNFPSHSPHRRGGVSNACSLLRAILFLSSFQYVATLKGLHLETYLYLARQGDLDFDAVPEYVEREFRKYLACGILAHGFARGRCASCGHDVLIALR